MRDSHKKSNPGKHRKRKKEKDLPYNKPFPAPGEDTIASPDKNTTTTDTEVPARHV